MIIYQPSLDCVTKVISKNLNLQYMNNKVEKVFSVKLIISFENAKKLSNYLIGAKIYSVGSLQCG